MSTFLDSSAVSAVESSPPESITADAIGALFDIVRCANTALNGESAKEVVKRALDTLQRLCDILGLLGKEIETEVPDEIKELLSARADARKNKQWQESDRLRDALKEKGYLVEDTPQGQKVTAI